MTLCAKRKQGGKAEKIVKFVTTKMTTVKGKGVDGVILKALCRVSQLQGRRGNFCAGSQKVETSWEKAKRKNRFSI